MVACASIAFKSDFKQKDRKSIAIIMSNETTKRNVETTFSHFSRVKFFIAQSINLKVLSSPRLHVSQIHSQVVIGL